VTRRRRRSRSSRRRRRRRSGRRRNSQSALLVVLVVVVVVAWLVLRDRQTTPPQLDESTEALLARLPVAAAGADSGYDRERFPHWSDEDGDGCDTRCEVLEAEQRPDGTWISSYDGVTTDDGSELDVDHVVALAEAWRSGAAQWDTARRERFANDLDDPDALVAVTASSNRSKADQDPATWQPDNPDARCSFAHAWVETKVRWDLTADQAEVDALRGLLARC
jgi:uncharacterized protein DUF1524